MPADLESILALEVPLIVQLGDRRMRVRDVLRLSPGSIIELPQNPDDPLALLVNNKVIGHGEAVKVGENFGIQITSIGRIEERVRALGDPANERSSSHEAATD